MDKYPVMMDGRLRGTLSVSREGALTVFEMSCNLPEGIYRMSVYGPDGREGYLGVLSPEGGRMCLRKSLSRNAMRAFPENILEAGPSGKGQAAAAEEKHGEEEKKQPAVQKAEAPSVSAAGELCWYSSPVGALVSFDREHSLLALPLGDERIPSAPPGEPRSIEGRDYLVYITRNLTID